jgi:hypothetical protein
MHKETAMRAGRWSPSMTEAQARAALRDATWIVPVK